MSDSDCDPSVFAGEKLDCDIVMKGGITSGVVYPGAIAELARDYRFRAIGGTSAGAIAAAIVAAAEHRRVAGDPAGFCQVAGLPSALGDDEGTGQLKLLRLFQPDRATRPLFRVLTSFLEHGRWLGIPFIWLALPLLPAFGLAVLVLGIVLGGAAGLVLGVVGALVLLLGPFADLVVRVVGLRHNHFGLCTLGPRSVGRGPALTEWLHEQIQTAAGRAVDGPVLTFADLWGIDPDERDVGRRIDLMLAPSADANERDVDLQMMTTDLTHGRPRRLPSGWHKGTDGRPHLDDGGGLFFERDVLERYFPPRVLEHMEAYAKPISAENAALLPGGGAGFRTFPMGPDLPVVVATRMSLSFPALIAAVPLWEIDHAAPGHPARRVLFSDGGITSNFPVHFFDAPLPRRPTFGLNLTSLPPDQQPPEGPEHQHEAVGPLPTSSGAAPDPPRAIESLPQFLTSIKDAMQNWRDNQQARQPGFRDRMVPIGLGAKEGGMALTMKRDKIADLSRRGAEAAKLLVARFAAHENGGDADGDAEARRAFAHSGWNDHRFVRFRITMASGEEFMKSFERAYHSPPRTVRGISATMAAATMPYEERVRLAGRDAPFALTAAQQEAAPWTADAYGKTLPSPQRRSLVDGAPLPRSALRVVPPT